VFNEFHYQVRGRAHEQDGSHGQDRTAYLSRHGVHVMCLADGAGSAARSEYGAQAVVNEGCATLAELFGSLIASNDADQSRHDILQRLHARLTEVAGRLDCRLADLASTFLCVAVSEGRFVAVHIGDGVIGYVRNGELRVVSGPHNDEFANQTTFVTSPNAAASMRLFRGSLDGVSGFVQMSDGTSASLYDYRTRALAPACVKLIEAVSAAPTRQTRNPEHKKRLRRLIDTRLRQATKDDCSIGILGRRS
jgi:hypothetical protein